ncbi:MAG: phytanoyl-CoA dioxygenase family protein [Gemmatimonadota bacterium]|nr:phytanoyl-CoA dioxygenase family protein [Gemmatimonadota bacterium]
METIHTQYMKDGYYITPDPVFPPDVVQRAADGMDAIRTGVYDTGVPPLDSPWNPGDDESELCKIEMPQIASRDVYELVSHSALGKLAAEVTGAEMVQVWWVQLLYKPVSRPEATVQTNVGWHQDRQYWSTWEEGSELFTAWVAVSDVTEDAGPMRFVRGSHTWGLLNQGGFFDQDHDAQRREIQPPDGADWKETVALLPPGGVSFHEKLTFHASGPNTSNGPRRSFAIHMRTQRSRPSGDLRQSLATYIDLPSHCPVVFGEMR